MKEILIKNKFSIENCAFCKEASLKVGEKSEYGAYVLFKIGTKKENSWFATLSPVAVGDINKVFSIQIIPSSHLKNFTEINENKALAENYGTIFAKISSAIYDILKLDGDDIAPIGTYGKCKHVDEHIHIKVFTYLSDVAQPFTMDSSYQKKEVFKDDDNLEFLKFKPVSKNRITENRLNYLKDRLISILNSK